MFTKSSFYAAAAGLAALARAAPLPQAQTSDWPAVWASQQAGMKSQVASMASVESTMGQAAAPATTAAPATSAFSAVNHQVAAPATTVSPLQTIEITPTASSTLATLTVSTAASSANSATGTPARKQFANNVAAANGPAVTNSAAWNGQDSTGPSPTDTYKCYGSGSSNPASVFPATSAWSAFEALYSQNVPLLQESCANLGYSPNNNDQQNGWIHDAIVQVGTDAAVDPRFILAIVMQESLGCLAAGTTQNGVTNPGLMQSHNGSHWVGNSASAADQQASIVQMIRDGTQGTQYGNGLVQEINEWGDVFTAARGYNSGDGGVTTSNLNAGNGATPSYVESVSNRLTGWVFNPGTAPSCPGE